MSTIQLQAKVDQQQQIIKYLASRYEQDTGRKMNMPTTLGELLGDKSILGELVTKEKADFAEEASRQADKAQFQEHLECKKGHSCNLALENPNWSFMEAIESLKLPKAQSKDKKKKKELRILPSQMVQVIDLSGFKGRQISRTGLLELVQGVEQLPCCKTVNLSNCGITEEHDTEILKLFDCQNVKNIDLSKNSISKKMGLAIGKKLRECSGHIQWFDITQNDFDCDPATVKAILQGMKRQISLIHAGVAVKGDQSREAIQLIKASKNHGVPPNCGMSLNIRNSTISTQGGNLLCKVLQHHDYYLTALNLKFCFLSFEHIQQISGALRTNKTLIKLDLSNNGLKHFTARYFLDAMLINEHLKIVNFHGNLLDDQFAVDLADMLSKNTVLHTVDISQNPIGPAGAHEILNTLLQKNDTLVKLGDLQENVYMGVRVREELRQVLKLNNSSHDSKKAYLEDKAGENKNKYVDGKKLDSGEIDDDPFKVIPVSKQMDYPLLQPIQFTNQEGDDYLNSGVWCLKDVKIEKHDPALE